MEGADVIGARARDRARGDVVVIVQTSAARKIDESIAVGDELRIAAGAVVEERYSAAAQRSDGSVAGRRESIELQVAARVVGDVGVGRGRGIGAERSTERDQSVIVIDDGRISGSA